MEFGDAELSRKFVIFYLYLKPGNIAGKFNFLFVFPRGLRLLIHSYVVDEHFRRGKIVVGKGAAVVIAADGEI